MIATWVTNDRHKPADLRSRSLETDRANNISALFPIRTSVSVACPATTHGPLFQSEAKSISTATPRRRQEFAAGRACARAALLKLGVTPSPIDVGFGRAPVWPAGCIGSISHCEGFCCAVTAFRELAQSVGIDIEPVDSVTPDLVDLVCSSVEQSRLHTLTGRRFSNWATVMFCAKEAFYKCYFPLSRKFLEFNDVQITILPSDFIDAGSFTVNICDKTDAMSIHQDFFKGRWLIEGGRVHAGVAFLPPRWHI